MIDYRHETFYELCRIRSYTKTAEYLHITQPAVSQHIRHLESWYGGSLFEYRDKRLNLTPRGEQLYRYVQALRADSRKVRQELLDYNTETLPVVFGATLTIGEYVMPAILEQILKEKPDCNLSMKVENTQSLLRELQDGSIDFALLEGYFDKARYASCCLSYEELIPVCSADSALAGRCVSLEEITGRRLILREAGSGTREVFEQALKAHNYSIGNFANRSVIGNMNAIKQLVSQDVGYSFLYLQAVKTELSNGTLAEFQIEGFGAGHEFNFVFLKDRVYEEIYHKWFTRISSAFAGSDNRQPDGRSEQ